MTVEKRRSQSAQLLRKLLNQDAVLIAAQKLTKKERHGFMRFAMYDYADYQQEIASPFTIRKGGTTSTIYIFKNFTGIKYS